MCIFHHIFTPHLLLAAFQGHHPHGGVCILYGCWPQVMRVIKGFDQSGVCSDTLELGVTFVLQLSFSERQRWRVSQSPGPCPRPVAPPEPLPHHTLLALSGLRPELLLC